MNDRVKEILLKQMELLQEESQRNVGDIGHPDELANISRAMAEIAKLILPI